MTRQACEDCELIFQSVGARAEGVTCEALLGLLKESEDLLKETGKSGPVQDAGLIACPASRAALRDRPLRHAPRVGHRRRDSSRR